VRATCPDAALTVRGGCGARDRGRARVLAGKILAGCAVEAGRINLYALNAPWGIFIRPSLHISSSLQKLRVPARHFISAIPSPVIRTFEGTFEVRKFRTKVHLRNLTKLTKAAFTRDIQLIRQESILVHKREQSEGSTDSRSQVILARHG